MSEKTSKPDDTGPAQHDSGIRPAESSTPDKRRDGKRSPRIDPAKVIEIGGPRGPEPTRYGDWEKKGRCIDF